MNIQECKNILMEKARDKFQDCKIFPCGEKRTFDECFTFVGDNCLFWFNTSKDCSTRVVKITLN